MTSNTFLFSTSLSAERLSWIAESLKNFFVSLHPDALRHPIREKEPSFCFFLTGDALYSLHEEETMQIWDVILALPSVWLVCDRREMGLRGLSVTSLKMKFPDQIFDQSNEPDDQLASFWKEVIRICRQIDPDSKILGYLQLTSPYMNRSAQNSVTLLGTALSDGLSLELYATLDGIHLGHVGQDPAEFRNIGNGLLEIAESARRKNLQFTMLSCGRDAAARGYNTWDDGKGVVISTCMIEPCKIRNLKVIVDRFRRHHLILAESAGIADTSQFPSVGIEPWEKVEPTPPPVVIIITHSPYGTEHAFGGVSFAIACAHHGIATQVIFIEDGIYTLTGTHSADPDDVFFNLQDVINAAGGNENLEFYVYQPSLHKRTIQKNKNLNAVLDIGPAELTSLLFSPPRRVRARHQRILFF